MTRPRLTCVHAVTVPDPRASPASLLRVVIVIVAVDRADRIYLVWPDGDLQLVYEPDAARRSISTRRRRVKPGR